MVFSAMSSVWKVWKFSISPELIGVRSTFSQTLLHLWQQLFRYQLESMIFVCECKTKRVETGTMLLEEAREPDDGKHQIRHLCRAGGHLWRNPHGKCCPVWLLLLARTGIGGRQYGTSF